MTGMSALYIILLSAVAGYLLIARVPSILHTPMLSGSNFIHGIVLAGAMLALGSAEGSLETAIGFVAVVAAAANVAGGFVVTDRMLSLFNKNQAQEKRQRENGLRQSQRIPADEDRRLPSTVDVIGKQK